MPPLPFRAPQLTHGRVELREPLGRAIIGVHGHALQCVDRGAGVPGVRRHSSNVLGEQQLVAMVAEHVVQFLPRRRVRVSRTARPVPR